MKLKINPRVQQLAKKSYADGKTYNEGMVLDCSMGSNPYGFSNNVRIALASLEDRDVWDYPRGSRLHDQIREYWRPLINLSPGQIELCDGGVHGFTLVNTLFQRPGAVVVGVSPQFSEYVSNARMLGYEYRAAQLSPRNGYGIRIDEIIELIDGDTSLVYLDNPNNPTGQAVPLGDLRRLLEAAAKNDAVVLVDEAYGGFVSDNTSATTLVNEYENLIVTHTFSKAHGLAGMHAGYIVTCGELSDQLRKLSHEFACSGIARMICAVAINDKGYMAECRRKIGGTKKRLQALVKRPLFMAKTTPSVPVCLLYHADASVNLTEEFRLRGIHVVSGTDFENLGQNCARVRIPSEEAEGPLFDAVRQIVGHG